MSTNSRMHWAKSWLVRRSVLSRGRVIVENDQYTGTRGDGMYLRRGLCGYLQ